MQGNRNFAIIKLNMDDPNGRVAISPVRPRRWPEYLVGLILLIGIAGLIYLQTAKRPIAPTDSNPVTQIDHQAPKVKLSLLATGLPNPTGIVASGVSDDDRLFVLDRQGIIRIVNQDGSIIPEAFLDIREIVLVSDEMGLLGLAFSPTYSNDGFFFVSYVDKQQTSVVSRYKVSDDANRADKSSAQTVLSLKQPYTNHNGGDVVFGPDGYLYVAFGDGGGQGDPENRSQDMDVWFGKILRLDVSQLPYKIPSDNPYVGQTDKAPEIWASGLRNPWRISFDKQTGDLFIADVGADAFEEVNFQPVDSNGGDNYGWRCYEANRDNNTDGCQIKSQYVFPVIEYDHNNGRCSITGGYVYRGTRHPSLVGKYFYGDFCNGQLFAGSKTGNSWQSELVATTPYMFSAFGQRNDGELYVADFKTGSLYSIEEYRP
jgi:glucose/arabinose dehydrogenase